MFIFYAYYAVLSFIGLLIKCEWKRMDMVTILLNARYTTFVCIKLALHAKNLEYFGKFPI